MNKGYVLISTLMQFLVIMVIVGYQVSVVTINSNVLLEHQKRMRCLETERQIITKIKDDLINYQEQDFTMEINQQHVTVTFDDVTAYINIQGDCQLKSVLVFDDFDNIIKSYEYLP